jgi:DNA-binding NtrC family response regulator
VAQELLIYQTVPAKNFNPNRIREPVKKKLILIVDDEPQIREILQRGLSRNGYSILLAENGDEAVRIHEREVIDLVITDVQLPDLDGLQLLDTIKTKTAHIPVMIMTGYGSIENAVEAMRRGAFDYLLKPFSLEALQERIDMALGKCTLNLSPSEEDPELSFMPIITRDRRMKEMIHLCDKVGPSKATILIQGESGTGKELFARYLHAVSPRKEGPFVAVNCASLPETLFESELFGHEKGAFTGALGRKIGKFELAQGGTILLDEISEMSPLLQAKILRVLQENEVDRIGGREPVPVDIRVVATTNKDLEACIEKGEFREDLYYRLNVISLKLAPLRERHDDIELLSRHFLKKFAAHYQKPVDSFSEEAVVWLKEQRWRGNVRELKNLIERAVLMSCRPFLEVSDFGPEGSPGAGHALPTDSGPLSLREMEKKLIFNALERTNGNRTHAARMLGISIRTLRNKLHEYEGGFSSLDVA